MEKVLISKEKLAELKKELEVLINVERPNIITAIQDARAQGDLSENADYDAAKDKQGIIEGRITEIEYILANYALIDNNKKTSNTISVGCSVVIENISDKEQETYQIVGELEASPLEGKISLHSPFAKSLLNKSEGDEVLIQGVETPYKVKIIKISNK
ncbi:MAG: transcription elongation factor GreA [Mycoplasmataceae bacterium]|nr:transcription elongation factor GreA [Mycoplasmataceae bacterium]